MQLVATAAGESPGLQNTRFALPHQLDGIEGVTSVKGGDLKGCRGYATATAIDR